MIELQVISILAHPIRYSKELFSKYKAPPFSQGSLISYFFGGAKAFEEEPLFAAPTFNLKMVPTHLLFIRKLLILLKRLIRLKLL